ncbi:MAG: GntR family transcriptional regulator [Acidobacteriota bacterium]
MLRLSIDESSAVPVHQQLKQAIMLDILSERFQSGDRMPSIRSLAKILKINPNTVAKVYYTLEEEGFVEGKRGSGYILTAKRSRTDKFREGLLESEVKSLLEKALSLGFTKKDLLEIMRRLLENG